MLYIILKDIKDIKDYTLIFSPNPGQVQWRRQDDTAINVNQTSTDKPNTLTLMDIIDDNEGDYVCYPSADENITATITVIVEGTY